MRALALALALSLPAVAAAQTPDAAEVVAAERAFAADYPGLGMGASFRKWAEPGAIMIAGGRAQTVEQVFPPEAPPDPQEPLLEWWPNFAGISRSGDLGFTTGGVSVNGERAGHYFTVWRRQPDGSWKWVYDGGAGASAADVPGRDSEPELLPLGPEFVMVWSPRDGSNLSTIAMRDVREMEVQLARAVARDQVEAHLAVLADRGRVYVAPLAPAVGPAAAASSLKAWPETFEVGPMEGGGASEAGDLVWTYSPALWSHEEQPRTGHFVRLWQRQDAGWKLVLVQLIFGPPPPPLLVAPPPPGS